MGIRRVPVPARAVGVMAPGQRLTPNRFYGRGAAAAVIRRAHSGWRAVLRAHHPLHPLAAAGRADLLERQVSQRTLSSTIERYPHLAHLHRG